MALPSTDSATSALPSVTNHKSKHQSSKHSSTAPVAGSSRPKSSLPSEATPREKKSKRSGKRASGAISSRVDQQQHVHDQAIQPEPSEPDMPLDTEEWSWMPLTDRSSPQPAVFSKDGRHFFLPSSSTIKIYSTDTLKVVSTLSSLTVRSASTSSTPSDSHTGIVTAVLLNPNNPLQLYSASQDGTIKIWDWLEGVLLKSITYGAPITHMCAHAGLPDVAFVAATKEKPARTAKGESKANCVIARVSLKTNATSSSDTPAKPSNIEKIGTIKPITGLCISPSGSWLVATSARTSHVSSTADPKKGFCKFVSPSTAALTCLAFHPSQDYFATGDADGQIHLWYCLNEREITFAKLDTEKKGTTTTLHWHAHAVAALAFTPNGAYLVSGGVESTMVLWHVETKKPGFIPRVGAPIRTASVIEHPQRGQEILLDLADGTLACFNGLKAAFRMRTDVVKLNSPSATNHAPLLSIDPTRNVLALPSYHSASLQLYSPYTSAVQELEVAPSNRVSQQNDASLISPSSVVQAAFDSTGKWLATVDEKEATLDTGALGFLKFWNFDAATSKYELHSRIDKPHGSEKVVSIQFSPTVVNGLVKLATAGSDGVVKVWGTRKTSGGRVAETWVNRASIRYRDEIPRDLSFSPDGSILAVAHGPFVTLWDGRTHSLIKAISTLPFKSVSSLAFVGPSGRHLAICGTGKEPVLLWDLILNRTIYRILPSLSGVPRVVPRFGSNEFAVVASSISKTLVGIHQVTRPEPLRTRMLPFSADQIGCLQARRSTTDFTLVVLGKDGTTYLVGDHVSLPKQEGSVERSLAQKEHARLSLFEDVFGRSAFKDLEVEEKQTEEPVDESFGASINWKLLDGPAHLIPPMETMFASLMEGVLLRRPGQEEEEVELEEEVMEIDEPVEQEEDGRRMHERNVDEKEMKMLVELFKEHAVMVPPASKSTTSPASKEPTVNGKPNGIAVNGLAPPPPTTNGPQVPKVTRKQRKETAKLNGLHVSAPTQLPSPSPTPTPTQTTALKLPAGKKRKHSLDSVVI